MPPRPSSPWKSVAVTSGPRSGAAAPRATRSRAAGAPTERMRWTLAVVKSTGTLPATEVTASTDTSGEASARSMASASSIPGSVSISHGTGTAVPSRRQAARQVVRGGGRPPYANTNARRGLSTRSVWMVLSSAPLWRSRGITLTSRWW